MVYGDNPQKINEREDALGLEAYAYAPDIEAIIQSSNLFLYTGNNPVLRIDSTGQVFMLVTGVIGAVVGGIGGAIYSQVKYGEVHWQNIAAGAAIGGAVGLTGGAATGVAFAGSAAASTGAVLTGISATATSISAAAGGIVYKSLEEGVNFTQTTIKHMEDPNRFVPVQTLIQAIKNGVPQADPQGTNAIMYTIEMFRNGKAYTLEVLYDWASNTIYHFMYK